MYAIVLASHAQRSLRKYRKSGSFPKDKFKTALMCLREGKSLPISYQDHALKGELQSLREFHLGYDLLVEYRRNELEQTVTIRRIGTHSELFGG